MISMTALIKDLKFALRVFAKSPGFTTVVAVSLALGIGANSAIFSLVNGLLLRPLPHIEEPGRLVRIYTTKSHTPGAEQVSYPDYVDYLESDGIFTDVTVYSPLALSLATDGQPEFVFAYIASGNYFSLLGIEAALGRTFTAAEDESPGEQPVVVLSHDFWKRRFSSDADVVGKTVKLNAHSFTIVGIAPEGFIGTEVIVAPDIWIPIMMQAQVMPSTDLLHDRETRVLRCTARLESGVTVEQARAQVQLIGQRLAQEYPEENGDVLVDLVPESEARIEVGVGEVLSLASAMLLVLVGLVLLIACANVANMLMARALGRQKEICLRLALGASRWRLVRQLLTESILLALMGGTLGLLLAVWVARLMESLPTPPDFPLQINVPLDLRVLTFSLAISILAGVVFGLIPGLQASRTDLVLALKSDASQMRAGPRRWALGKFLVVAQVAVSLVLLITAGLFVRSLRSAQTVDLGMDPESVLTFSVDLDMRGYSAEEGRRFYRDVVERVEALPGVRSISLAEPVPMGWSATSSDVAPEGDRLLNDDQEMQVGFSIVGVDYFTTLHTPLVKGRPFEERDDQEQPMRVIVNETLAERFWPGEDPLGKRLRLSTLDGDSVTVIGVAQDGKYRLLSEAPQPYMYLPLRQVYTPTISLVARTAGDPSHFLETLRREVHALDSDLVTFNAQPLEKLISQRTLMPLRLMATIASAFGVLGMILAAVGLYGVISYTTSRRTREIGLRMAMGARVADVLRLVLRQGMLLTLTGLMLGLGLATALSRMLSGLLVGVGVFDPVVFAVTAGGLIAVALAATLFPARRAIKINPASSLRME